jgi:hypothetical protein
MSDQENPKYTALSEYLTKTAEGFVFMAEDLIESSMMSALNQYSTDVEPLEDWTCFHDLEQNGDTRIDVAVKFKGEDWFVYVPIK